MSLFVIKTIEQVKEKYDLITALLDIQIATDIRNKSGNTASAVAGKKSKDNIIKLPNPVDTHFAQLKCSITWLDPNYPAYKAAYQMIEQYVQRTSQGCPLKIVDCFMISREGEDKRYNPLKLGNKKLLWHGSRFSNFVGILS